MGWRNGWLADKYINVTYLWVCESLPAHSMLMGLAGVLADVACPGVDFSVSVLSACVWPQD